MSMYEQQQLFDLQDTNNGANADPATWLSHEQLSQAFSTGTGNGSGVVDPLLYNDLVQIVPLVQSLIHIDRKAKTSFTRRGSMTYTKMPSRESLYRKTSEAKGRNTGHSGAMKNYRDLNRNTGGSGDECAESSSRSPLTEKDREELMALREQVEDLQKKLLEKEELLKEAEILKNEMASTNVEHDQIKKETSEKETLFKSIQVQLSDAKVKLADKIAAVEKLEWEAMTSNKKVERLDGDLDAARGEISSFIQFAQALLKNDSGVSAEEYDVIPYLWDQSVEIDHLKETEMQKLEEAREAYIAAVAAAKENQDEASLSAAATTRSFLQSLVLRA